MSLLFSPRKEYSWLNSCEVNKNGSLTGHWLPNLQGWRGWGSFPDFALSHMITLVYDSSILKQGCTMAPTLFWHPKAPLLTCFLSFSGAWQSSLSCLTENPSQKNSPFSWRWEALNRCPGLSTVDEHDQTFDKSLKSRLSWKLWKTLIS